MTKTDCFAYCAEKGRCNILTELLCRKRECSFYKTQKQQDADNKRYPGFQEEKPREIRTIICVETGERFPSYNSAAKAIGVRHNSIVRACSGYQERAGGYRWQLEAQGIVEKPKMTPVRRDKSVLCVETGKLYPEMIAAAKDTGVAMSSISKVCNGHQKMAGGYHWQFGREREQ